MPLVTKPQLTLTLTRLLMRAFMLNHADQSLLLTVEMVTPVVDVVE